MGHLSSLFLTTLSTTVRLTVVLFIALLGLSQPVSAADPDLPVAVASPIAGIGFDDKPLFLPVQKNFQMAMLTAGSELGRTCGKMEAYGWRMGPSEQSRVDQIFNTAVDRFRGLGYEVEMQSPSSVSRDITLFTADSSKKHFMAMWSAGEIGLVMVLCETGSAHAPRTATKAGSSSPSVQTFLQQPAAETSKYSAGFTSPTTNHERFSPIGTWVGSYICDQGYTGGTLTISQLRGDNFEGTFRFYPTPKNPTVPPGSYAVSGQYDAGSQRILINPGRWLQRPANYYNTIIIGSFDPATKTLSAYFQGVNGCTSFEAKQTQAALHEKPMLHHRHAVKAKVKKTKAAVEKTESAKPAEMPSLTAPAASAPVAPVAPATPAMATPAAPVKPAEPVSDSKPVDAATPSVLPAATTAEPAAPSPAPVPAAPAASAPTPKAEAPFPPPDVPPLTVGAPTPGLSTGTAPVSSLPTPASATSVAKDISAPVGTSAPAAPAAAK